MDGNFQLDRKKSNAEGPYYSLTDGQGYFPLQRDFKNYLAKAIDEPTVRMIIAISYHI